MRYQIRSRDGKSVLCTYKASPEDILPVNGFIGEAALLLTDATDIWPVTFHSERAAERCVGIYGGRVEFIDTPIKEATPQARLTNGGW